MHDGCFVMLIPLLLYLRRKEPLNRIKKQQLSQAGKCERPAERIDVRRAIFTFDLVETFFDHFLDFSEQILCQSAFISLLPGETLQSGRKYLKKMRNPAKWHGTEPIFVVTLL